MMSSEERHEVAKLLRGAAHRHDAVECGLVTNMLGLEYGIYGSVVAFPSDAVSRLADLIDPTCEMVVKNGRTYCGKCGRMLECEIEDDCYKFTPFCPGCGVRVVADDGK